MNPWNQEDALLLFIGILLFLIIVCLIAITILWSKIRKWQKLFDRGLVHGESEESLMSMLQRLFDVLDKEKNKYQSIEEKITTLSEVLRKQKGNLGIVRFNAFSNEGSDLSFSIALIDQEETGFVLTSIFGRDESRVYAKPLERGKSVYLLTEEEKRAIEDAKVLS